MDLTNLSYEALHRYFTRLAWSGYVNYKDVDSLIILIYIQEILEEFDLDEDELNIIIQALSCLQGSSCMIPYTGCKGVCR